MNEINENNIQSYLGLDIIAVYDIFSCNDIFVLCRDGRQYILRGLSEKSLNMLLPQIFCAEDEKEECYGKMVNEDYGTEDNEALFGDAFRLNGGWYCSDMKFGGMGSHMYLSYRPEVANLIRKYQIRYFSRHEFDPYNWLDYIALFLEMEKKEKEKSALIDDKLAILRSMKTSGNGGILVADKVLSKKTFKGSFPAVRYLIYRQLCWNRR